MEIEDATVNEVLNLIIEQTSRVTAPDSVLARARDFPDFFPKITLHRKIYLRIT